MAARVIGAIAASPSRRSFALLLILFLACHGKEPTQPPPPPLVASELQSSDGDQQNGVVDQPLAAVLKVRAVSSNGVGVPGVAITWSTVDGGIVTGNSTDADGYATATWRLGTVAGVQHARAAVRNNVAIAWRDFTANAAAGPAFSARVDTRLFMLHSGETRSLSARAFDRFDNAVTDAPAWTTTNASIAGVDANGVVTGNARGPAGIVATVGQAADTVYLKVDQLAFASIAVGRYHTCALGADASLWCWGINAYGELGDGGTTTPRLTPERIDPARRYIALAAAWSHTCAISDARDVYCWGDNPFGKPNPTATDRSYVPTLLASSVHFSQVTTAATHGCALAVSAEAYCWGEYGEGDLGVGIASFDTYSSTPVPVHGGIHFQQIAAGGQTCAVSADSTAYCWGLLYGSTRQLEPTQLSSSRFAMVSADIMHSCALTGAGQAYCWGNNATGRIGDGTTEPRYTPTPVGARPYIRIQTAEQYTCALTRSGELDCWGFLQPGGNQDIALTPRAISTPEPATQISASTFHFCVVTRQGNAFCRGENYSGELGDGTTETQSTFVRVKDPY